MRLTGFNSRRAAQVAAFFARAQGGRINVLKLVKIIYLADRRSMEQFDAPILYDQIVSMQHGPVNSATLDLLNDLTDEDAGWREFIGIRQGHDVTLAREPTDADLDELSRRDLRVLAATWDEFGGWSGYALRDYTHAHCPEWEDPRGSSSPIPYSRVFKFLGKACAEELAESVLQQQAIGRMFESHGSRSIPELDAA